MTLCKHTFKDNEEHFDYPYYVPEDQSHAITTKRRWLKEKFPRREKIMVIDSPNSVHAFNHFEEGHVERYKCHFRLFDLLRDDLYGMY